MVLVIGNVCAGAMYADNVQLELTLITGLNLADARFYNMYNLVLLTDGCTIRRQGEKFNQTYTPPHACDCNYLLICLSEKKRRFIPAICSNTRLYIL